MELSRDGQSNHKTSRTVIGRTNANAECCWNRTQVKDGGYLSQTSQITTLLPIYGANNIIRNYDLYSCICHNGRFASATKTKRKYQKLIKDESNDTVRNSEYFLLYSLLICITR